MSNKTLEIVTNKIQIIINRETTDRLCLRKNWYRPLNFLILKRLGMFLDVKPYFVILENTNIGKLIFETNKRTDFIIIFFHYFLRKFSCY